MLRGSTSIRRRITPRQLAGLAVASALVATGAAAQAAAAPEPTSTSTANTTATYDPWEPVNRGLFAFGMGLDRVLLRPIAHGYMGVTPRVVRNRVSAAVYNLGEPSTTLEDVLQGRPGPAGRAGARFVVNSTVGLLGLFDVASRWGMTGHDADFGQTLGRYGAQPGPYLYMPVLGPLNLRDGVGRVVDVIADPASWVIGPITSPPGAIRAGVSGLDQRVAADPAFHVLDDATDPYVTARSAYTQHRAAVVDSVTGKAPALPDFDADPARP